MAILSTFTQQPQDVLDYDVDYTNFLASGETISSTFSATAEAGLTVQSVIRSADNTRIKVWITGGTSGQTYKVTVRVTTTIGRVKEDELKFRIKDY